MTGLAFRSSEEPVNNSPFRSEGFWPTQIRLAWCEERWSVFVAGQDARFLVDPAFRRMCGGRAPIVHHYKGDVPPLLWWGEGRLKEGSRCTVASFEIRTSVRLCVVKQRLAILGKLAKLDPSGRSTGSWTSPR